jgi:hypothetical protein
MLPGANFWKDEVRWNDCTGNWTVEQQGFLNPMVGEIITMTDTVIPRYHQRVRKGEVFFSPMQWKRVVSLPEVGTGRTVQKKTTSITCSGVPQKRINKGTQHVGFTCLTALGLTPPFTGIPVPVGEVFSASEIAAMQSEVSTRVMASRGLSDSNLFESIAEINQLAGAVTGPLQGLKSFLQQRTPKALAMGAAGAWLAYRYGVRPFINDIEAILKGLKKSVGKQRKTTRAFLSQERVNVKTLPSAAFGDWRANVQILTLDNVTCRAMSLDEYVADFSSNIGFTGKGLAGLPWELIPFSFVVDWFVNVGDFLYAYVPAFGYKQLGSCLVTRRFRSTTYTILDSFEVAGSTWDLLEAPTGTIAGIVETKTRSPLSDPKLAIKTNFRLDQLTRMADAIALLFVVSAMAARIFGGAPASPSKGSTRTTKVIRR